LSRMVQIDTNSVTKSGYNECASIIVEEAKRNALDVEIIDGEKAAKDGLPRPNVIVTLDAGSDVTLLLESHFDIVPPGADWDYPPFKLTIKDGKAYGRGAADNKSGIAAVMGAMRLLGKRRDLDVNLKLIAGVDEEIGGEFGVDYVLSDYKLKGDAGLVVDAGSEGLFLGASGVIWGKIIVQGIQGHAGYPFKAKNAIEETVRLLSEFEKYRSQVEEKESLLKAPSEAPRRFVWGRFTVTMIKAWEKENIIPGTCEIRFDRRLLPEEPVKAAEEELTNFFERAIKETGCRASLETIHRLSGYYTPSDHVFVQTVARSMAKTLGKRPRFAGELGGNDGSFFAKNGIPVVCYGPIRADTNYHGVNEFVHLEDLRSVRDVIVSLGGAHRDEIIQTGA